MEYVLNIVEGPKINPAGSCKFCGKRATKMFGIIDTENARWNGNTASLFRVCEEHSKAFDSLLNGNKDIDDLIKVCRTIRSRAGINLRANL